MKKFLPNSQPLAVSRQLSDKNGFTRTNFVKQNLRGFTLIELLIVVAIIAVLAVIGITIFGNVQKNARDARRKADINAIANVMEANYNTASCLGQYCSLSATYFANNQIPIDPNNDTTTCSGNICKYCVKAAAGVCIAADAKVNPGQPGGGPGYVVCTNLETASGTGGQNYECRKNQQ